MVPLTCPGQNRFKGRPWNRFGLTNLADMLQMMSCKALFGASNFLTMCGECIPNFEDEVSFTCSKLGGRKQQQGDRWLSQHCEQSFSLLFYQARVGWSER